MSILSSTCAGQKFLQVSKEYFINHGWISIDTLERKYIHPNHPGFEIIYQDGYDGKRVIVILCPDLIDLKSADIKTEYFGISAQDNVGMYWKYLNKAKPIMLVSDFEDVVKKIMDPFKV